MPKVLVCLPSSREKNPHQAEQEDDARTAAARAALEIEVHYARGDVAAQRTRIQEATARGTPASVDALIVMPYDEITIKYKVLEALQAGVPFWMINRNPAYLEEYRRDFPAVPVCVVAPDQAEVGRIQAQQCRKLLGGQGAILYLGHGGNQNWTANLRSQALREGLRDSGIQILAELPGRWEADAAYAVVRDWLGTAGKGGPASLPQLLVLQTEAMFPGAARALQERGLALPAIGCDGTPAGKVWVAEGKLAATVELPLSAGMACSAAAQWLLKQQLPPPVTVLPPRSYPPLERLSPLPPRRS